MFLERFTGFIVRFSRFITHRSNNVEIMYDKVADFGFAWTALMKVVQVLGIDGILLAPAKSKLVPVPLFMTTSEKCVKEAFKPMLGDVVLDVGAYIGRYTLIGSKYVGEAGKVIALEPDPQNFQIVEANVKMNRLNNVVLLGVAASNREGQIRLYQSGSGGWTSSVTATDRYVDVPCKTVDALLKEVGVNKVDWMKIDVEGAELAVLEGSKQTLSQCDDLKLIVEIHPKVADAKAIFALLEELHYSIEDLEKREDKPYHVLAFKASQFP